MTRDIDTTVNRVLVIDDNPAIHDDIRKVLEGPPRDEALSLLEQHLFGTPAPTPPVRFAVDHAAQGSIGLERVEAALHAGRPYMLAFVDMRMPPGWNGLETVERLWSVAPDLQVVICTAYSDHSWTEIVDRLGSSADLLVLKKPFDSVEVQQVAFSLCRKWQVEKALRERVEDLDAEVRARTTELERANTALERELAERKHVESELRLAQKLEAVGQLAAGIAHEINTPVQFIGDNLHFLGDVLSHLGSLREPLAMLAGAEAGSDDEREAAQELHEVLRRADFEYLLNETGPALQQSLEGVAEVARIVAAMREFAHDSAGEHELNDLNRIVESALTVTRHEWKHLAEVVTEFDPAACAVPCCRSEISQVLVNLIVNAAQAIEDLGAGEDRRGTITVRTRLEADGAHLEVTDTGCGIPASLRERVFDPFFTTKDVGRGTGQGLALAHALVVERHGGRIGFQSEVGRGSCFHVVLPLAGSAAS